MQAIKRRYKKATSTRKGRIIVLTLLVLILAAVAGGIFYWSVYKKRIIRSTLEDTLRRKSKGLYKVTYDDLKLDEVSGFLKVTNLRLEYDSLRYAALEDLDLKPPTLLRINIPELLVTGVKTPQALLDNQIVGGKVQITDPVIEIYNTGAGKDSARSTPNKEVYETILGNLELIKLDTVLITGAHITSINWKTRKRNVEVARADIQLLDVAVDSVSNLDKARILFSRSVSVNAGSVKWSSPDNLYHYGLDSVSLNTSESGVDVGRFYLEPQLGESAFVHSLPTQDDRFHFILRNISIQNLDYGGLFDETLKADTLKIGSGSFKIYRDLNIKRDKKNRVGTYPHQSIAKLPIPVYIKRLILQNAFVEYKEVGMVTKKAGQVQFFNSSATISNLTNNRDSIAKNNIMRADIRMSLLNKAPLTTVWNFYLLDKNGKFTVSGTLGKIARAEDLTVLTKPMGPASIEGGVINSLSFNLTGTDNGMQGTVKMLYDDLKVGVLAVDEDTRKIKKRKFISFAANVLVKNSNPKRAGDEPRVAEVSFTRDPNRSMWHMAWKTLFKGIKETVGINK